MPERITIIEPHADDAYLSLHSHISEWVANKAEVQIITVYSGTRKRGEDARRYAEFMGASWKGLGFEESGGTQEEAAHFDFTSVQTSGHMVFPLGLGHKEHVAVRQQSGYYDNPYYYVDAPYHTIQKNRQQLNILIKGMEIVSVSQPGANKFKHSHFFKDQSKFMYFNHTKIIQGMEIVVK